MLRIKEVIVVEGRDDEVALKRAVDAEVIITSGLGLTEQTLKRIEFAKEKCGIIIFTDPDFAGEKIRKRIDDRVPGCKHAFLPREEAMKGDNIGIENATDASIIAGLKKARCSMEEPQELFTRTDLVDCGLIGNADATSRRDRLGQILGIGYGNGKAFLKRLNKFGITREEFVAGLMELENNE